MQLFIYPPAAPRAQREGAQVKLHRLISGFFAAAVRVLIQHLQLPSKTKNKKTNVAASTGISSPNVSVWLAPCLISINPY